MKSKWTIGERVAVAAVAFAMSFMLAALLHLLHLLGNLYQSPGVKP